MSIGNKARATVQALRDRNKAHSDALDAKIRPDMHKSAKQQIPEIQNYIESAALREAESLIYPLNFFSDIYTGNYVKVFIEELTSLLLKEDLQVENEKSIRLKISWK